MSKEGKRIRRTRLIHSERFVVAVEVELVVPPDDPSGPCHESESIQFLRTVKGAADRSDLAWLKDRGKVYELVEAA